MHFLKLLTIALLAIHMAAAEEPAGIGSLAVPLAIDGAPLDPPGDGTDYRFSLAGEPRPAGWSLLLGALLSGCFIVRRRMVAS